MPKTKTTERTVPKFLIITGLSGSGMSSAMNAFEDLGYFCVDNLPVALISPFARLLAPNDEEVKAIEKAALVIDIRERHFLPDFSKELKKLAKKNVQPYVLFFEADDAALQRRFSETRRPHPAENGNGLSAAIRNEKEAMRDVRETANLIIDTSTLTVHSLRRLLVEKFSPTTDGVPLNVQIFSFGHKHGAPSQADLLFDVRHLPNPYFVPELKHLPGSDKKVVKFLEEQPEVKETQKRFADLLTYLLPLYEREGKSYLTIGIGCTGGKHRSVMIANSLGKILKTGGYQVTVNHRDVQK